MKSPFFIIGANRITLLSESFNCVKNLFYLDKKNSQQSKKSEG